MLPKRSSPLESTRLPRRKLTLAQPDGLYGRSLSHTLSWSSLVWTQCSSCLASPWRTPETLGQDSCPLLKWRWKLRLLIGPKVLLTLYRIDLSYWFL